MMDLGNALGFAFVRTRKFAAGVFGYCRRLGLVDIYGGFCLRMAVDKLLDRRC